MIVIGSYMNNPIIQGSLKKFIIQGLLEEISEGVSDETRTIEKVSNPDVKKLLEQVIAKADQEKVTCSTTFSTQQGAGVRSSGLCYIPDDFGIGKILSDFWTQKKKDEENERLKKVVIRKQDAIIVGLQKRFKEFQEKYAALAEQLNGCIELLSKLGDFENKEKELDELKKKYAEAREQTKRNEYTLAVFIILTAIKQTLEV